MSSAGAGIDQPLLSPDFLRQLDRLTVASRRPPMGVLQGERRSPRRGQAVEFADFRPYTPGDDPRLVDWNAYARLERFFLKLFVEEEDAMVHLLIDTSKSMGWGEPAKLDFAKSVAAGVAYIALANLEWIAVSPFTSTLGAPPRPQRGRTAAPRLFAMLADLRPAGGTDLAAAVRRYAATVRRPGPLLVLSDLYDPGWQDALRAAAGARFDVSVIHILSPEEVAPAFEGDLRLIDDETEEIVEVSADGDAMERYRELLDGWRSEIQAWCAKRAMPYVPVATDFPLEAFVLEVLRKKGVVG